MRKKLLVALALSAVLALAVTSVASAVKITLRAGNLITTFGGTVSPTGMPKKRFTPVKTRVFGNIRTSDGSHPSALREVVVDIDKDVRINARGLPACKPGQLVARNTRAAKRVCGKSTVGKGNANVEIEFPEQAPIVVKSPLTVFSGGQRGNKVKLLIHVFITVPVPAAIVTQVNITKRGTGVHTVSRVPVTAGGSGSALSFNFVLGRNYRFRGRKIGYFEARCPDRRFKVNAKKILFKNEARTAGAPAQTVMKGRLQVPCRPKGR